MSTRNRPQRNENFDLDQFLEDKASGSESNSQEPEVQEPSKIAGFFRNTLIVLVAIFGLILWYHDWNPRQAYVSIFGSETNEPVVIESTNSFPEVPAPPVPVSPNADRIAELERSAVALAQSEELERLTEQSVALALESAFEALGSLENMDFSGLEGLESLEALEGLEGLEGFEVFAEQAALEALRNIDFSQIEIETGTTNLASFEQFSRELTEKSIDQFTDEELRTLHSAGVPSSFLSQLNDVGLLDRLDAEEIIALFEDN